MTAAHALLVALGAAAGAPARVLVGHVVRRRLDTGPWVGTLAVNVLGSFVLGLLVGGGAGAGTLALLGTGFCGAFTTFSTLALEIEDARAEGEAGLAARIVGASLVLGVGAAGLGYALAR